MKRVLGFCMVLVMAGFAAAQEDPFRSAPPEEDEALRARVNGFYSLFQEGKFRQAEAFVAEDSRDLYYNAPKTRIFSYSIKNVEFNPDLDEADVLITAETMSALSAQPLEQPLPSKWERIEGEWFLKIKGVKQGQSYDSPAGPLNFDPQTGSSGARPANFEPPNLASMQTMYEVDSRILTFPGDSAEPVTQTVTVKNKFDDELTIDRLTRDFPGMEIQVESLVVPKGGETKISFTYHPEVQKHRRQKHFDFNVMPITQRVRIMLRFR